MSRFVTTLCLAASIGLGFAPPNVQSWLRAAIRDGFQPGVTLAAAAQQSAARQLQLRFVGDAERELQSQISNPSFLISNSICVANNSPASGLATKTSSHCNGMMTSDVRSIHCR